MRPLPLALLLIFVATAPLFGWGCEGHQAVALIARAHLTPAASAAVDKVLRDSPIDPALKRFCQERPSDPMADSATWADDARTAERTGSWHFVDIPLTVESGTKLDEWCPPVGPSENGKDRPGCVTNAIAAELAALRDPASTPSERAMALRYVIHFVGDMHQPLHVSDNDDRGGNCTAMSFFNEEKPANLHAIWDYKVIARELAQRHLSIPEYAKELDRRFAAKWQDWGQSTPDPQTWAWEGHAVALRSTYAGMNPAIPHVQTPRNDCDAERASVTALHISLGDDYYNQAAPVIDEQIAKAGYRLAAVLNAAFR